MDNPLPPDKELIAVEPPPSQAETAESALPASLNDLSEEAYAAKMQQARKWVLWAAGILGVIVALVLGFGAWKTYVEIPNLPIATVDGTEITVRMYQTRARYFRWQLLQESVRLQETILLTGDSSGTLIATYAKIQSLLDDPTQLGQSVMNSLLEDIIIQREADALGIVITDQDVEAAFYEKLKETSAAPDSYTNTDFAEDYAAFVQKNAAAGIKAADLRAMRRNILLRQAIQDAITGEAVGPASEQEKTAYFNEWLQTERMNLAATAVIDIDLMSQHTPTEPSLADPAVFEAIFGISLRDYTATSEARETE